MDWITHDIAIGNCDDARRFPVLQEAGIVGILSLNGWPNSAHNQHGMAWRCVELIDGFGNPVSKLHEAVTHLHELLSLGKVLAHCMQGVSRTPLVVASYLADRDGRPFEDCLEHISQRRKWVALQPGLLELRRAYEAEFAPHARVGAIKSPAGG